MEKIKVVIADDHALYRDGLKNYIIDSGEMEVLAEARDGHELVKQVKHHQPDVVVTDLLMKGGNGIEAIREIYLSGIRRIIAISTYDTNQLIIDALQAGALGYIVKNADRNEITDAIKKVYHFEKYYCKFTSSKLLRSIHKITFLPTPIEKPDLLSEKEKEIVRLICQGKTSEEIGAKLYMSKRTVEGFRARILLKVNEKTLQGLVIYAIKNNIYNIDSDNNNAPE